MAKELKISGLVVLKLDRNGNVLEIIQSALGQSAGTNPLLTDLPYGDTLMHGLGTTLQGVYTRSKLTLPTASLEDVKVAVNNVVDAWGENANVLQSAARKAAKAAGDVNVGINLVKNTGYKLKQVASAVENTFTLTAVGGGAVDVDTKSPGKGAVYIRKYGKAPAENVVPKPEDIRELQVGREGPSRTERLIVGEWYAFCEATIMPIPKPHVNNSAQAPTQAEEKSTETLTTSKRRRTFIDGDESNYDFGPWLWILVR